MQKKCSVKAAGVGRRDRVQHCAPLASIGSLKPERREKKAQGRYPVS